MNLAELDAKIQQFEERNADNLVTEAEARLNGRILCFTRVELMRGMITLAALRASVLLTIDANKMRATVTAKDGKLIPAVLLDEDIDDETKTKFHTMCGAFFKDMCVDWSHDLQHGHADTQAFEQLREHLEKKGESFDSFARRLKKWSS